MKAFSLTDRDIELLEAICAFRAVPIEQLAARFFANNPFTGAENRNPEAACARRLATLSAAGLVMKFSLHDGSTAGGAARGDDGSLRRRGMRVLVGLGPKAETVLGSQARRHVPIRKLAHHARTMDALLLVEESVRARGGRVIAARIEQQVRSDQQRGRFLQLGDSFDPFPDAVCTAELPFSSGSAVEMRRVEIAVEYATGKYTDEDIKHKHEGFTADAGYDEVLWFADKAATRERVKRVTGGTCSIVN